MKYVKIVASLLFLLFAYFQLNDAQQYGNDDPWFWVVFYLVTAGLTAASLKWKLPAWSYPLMIGFCLGAAIFRMQDEVGNFDFSAPLRATAIPAQMNQSIQKPNEVGGLLLVGAWTAVLAATARKGGRR
ncbi:MAG: transmembrane 220 family protein [Verrucomicrobiota bacterium JB023]|nr:transmembrane 220 family protein [Verrucomicrobiota bacterium JB023]